MLNEDSRRLEEKIAYLERHVTEQDKAMFEMAEDIAKLRRELKQLREQPSSRSGADEDLPDERPPHY
ncbi:SlyX family protein [Opitutus sp. ER46]|uniref:SlyX family protein n=1 Tax=Opitutus sp. ER46 TaxID=2161864 RepID=UPI000D30CC8E|nr:SlyX family protein [Opitutus sp. ER46]PTX95512.1 SlyX protein [Opitutus sp. ER46]